MVKVICGTVYVTMVCRLNGDEYVKDIIMHCVCQSNSAYLSSNSTLTALEIKMAPLILHLQVICLFVIFCDWNCEIHQKTPLLMAYEMHWISMKLNVNYHLNKLIPLCDLVTKHLLTHRPQAIIWTISLIYICDNLPQCVNSFKLICHNKEVLFLFIQCSFRTHSGHRFQALFLLRHDWCCRCSE